MVLWNPFKIERADLQKKTGNGSKIKSSDTSISILLWDEAIIKYQKILAVYPNVKNIRTSPQKNSGGI